ncbi:MAG TPA: hypothetical protein VFU89_02430 [Rhabdochlamydiaceae bacterium]|nr:hypothetical protein [Rhabdochlamydiaceae bacterium]
MRYILVLILMFSVPCMKAECGKKHRKNLPLTQVEVAKNTLLQSQQRTDLINYLIVKNGYKKYLEIGVADGENFRRINAPEKVGVDPSPAASATYRMTSDEFF